MNKRGVSRTITVLFLILLGLAAFIVIWNTVRLVLEKENEISQLRTQLLLEGMDIVKIEKNPLDNLNLTLAIRKNNEKVKYVGTEIITGTQPVDIISVVDLSGSMLPQCMDLKVNGYANKKKCCNSLGGNGIFPSPPTDDCLNIINQNLQSVCEGQLCKGKWANKILAAKNANKAFINPVIEANSNNRLGLIGYSTKVLAANVLDFTNDKSALNSKIDSWSSLGSTCICCGILAAGDKFLKQSPKNKPKAMILMSDGIASEKADCLKMGNVGDLNNDGLLNRNRDYAINASWNVSNMISNLVIYTIGFGDQANPEDLDEETLKLIAQYGNGEYSYANINTILETYKSVTDKIINKYQTIKTINYLKIVFYNKTDSYQEIISNPPERIYEIKKYNLDMNGKISNIQKVEIYPVVISSTGEEVIGGRLDVWNLY